MTKLFVNAVLKFLILRCSYDCYFLGAIALSGGRNPETGKKVNQRVGGGYKFDWLWISFRRIGPTDGTFMRKRLLKFGEMEFKLHLSR
ncbi:Large ribosomal subunit protein [Trichinella spiralis]|uniref:Large ribosomal subunit protein n=1 Tax=Trichinella spiralis TaxID=6334 RepID=A0ABR3KSY3_TRISP